MLSIGLAAATRLAASDAWNESRFRIDGKIAFLSGAVAHHQLFSLQSAAPTLSHIVLNSAGGDAVAAIAIAREVRRRRLTTYVGPYSQCASACTIIFQGGAVRVVHPQVFFAYHTPRWYQPSRASVSTVAAGRDDVRASFRALYRELGVPESTIQEFWHPHVMFYYGADELLRRNIATAISDMGLTDR